MTQKIYTTYVELSDDTYYNRQTITQVDLMQTPWVNNRMWGAFENCYNLQTVTNIEQNVTNMQAAFYGCTNLTTTPTLPASVTSLNSCFYGCSNITAMPTIPSNVTDMSYSFMYCNKLNTITTIPASVNDVCYAFAYTNINTAPALPQNLTELVYTFAFCNELTAAPTIPANVTVMEGAFQGCKKLTTAPTLPNSVEDLSYTFSGCNTLTSAPEIPNTVRYLDETFKDCTALTGNIIIRTDNIVHNVTAINTFDNTSARKNVYIPPVCYNDVNTPSETYNAFIEAGYDTSGTKHGVYLCYNYAPVLPSDWITSTAANGTTILEQYIGTNTAVVTPHNDWYSNKVLNISTMAYPNYIGPFIENPTIVSVDLCNIEVINNNFACGFMSCQNLQSVTNINSNITNMSRTFAGCPNLVISPSLPPNVTNLAETYLVSYNLQTAPSIPQTVDDMYRTFASCQSLSTIPTIPDSVTNTYGTFYGIFNLINANFIANGTLNTAFAFESCVNLQTINVNIPKATNAASMFGYCTNLTDINIIAPKASSINDIFTNCNSLTNVHAEFNSATNIANLFYGLPNLETVNLSAQNTTNAAYLFQSCYALNSIIINLPNVTDLTHGFAACHSLSNIPALPPNVTSLDTAFGGCWSLVDAPSIPSSVTYMPRAFTGCNNLINAPSIPNSVTQLFETFQNCYSLVNVPTLPDSVTYMYETFSGCNSLVSINHLPNNLTDMQWTFNACSNLVSVPNIPNTVTNMYLTFNGCVNLTGNIYIYSNQVSYASGAFANTSLIKNVYIPYEYANGVNTVTRNTFEAAYPINTISGTTYGTLTDNNGVISGFSTSNYIKTTTTPPTPITSFEEVLKIHVNSITPPVSPKQCMVAGDPWLGLGTIHIYNDGKLQVYISSTGTSNDIANGVYGSTALSANTDYWIKFSWDGNTYKVSVSTDGSTYTDHITINSNLPPAFNGVLGYGTDTGASNNYPFDGSIDLKECYVKVNGQKVWSGYVRPNGVVLKDIDGSKITINPTPADATVLIYSEAAGKEIDEDALNKFTYVKVGDDVTITGLNTTDTEIVVPSMWTETKGLRAIDGSTVYYKVFKEGYDTVESEITVDGSQTIDVNLEQTMCTYTVIPMPQDATVTLTAPGVLNNLYGWFPDKGGSIPSFTTSETPAINDIIYQYNSTTNTYEEYAIITTINGDLIRGTYISEPTWSTGQLYRENTYDTSGIIGPAQVGNSITVPWNTEVSYTVSKAHYTTVTSTEIVKATQSRYVPLTIDKHTFTINPTPADAAVQILVNGRLVNALSDDWVFTANNLNGDIELQEYIGSNTVVSMPTSFETTNTVTADYGSTIEWKVSKDGYLTETGTQTLTSDTTLNIELGIPQLNVTDYNYTNNDGVVVLTKYIGTGGDIDTPEIEKG